MIRQAYGNLPQCGGRESLSEQLQISENAPAA
jgi:hypothetical protein